MSGFAAGVPVSGLNGANGFRGLRRGANTGAEWSIAGWGNTDGGGDNVANVRAHRPAALASQSPCHLATTASRKTAWRQAYVV